MGVVNALVACQVCARQAISNLAVNFIMTITSCSPDLPAEYEQLSIIITQRMLELLKLPRSCHSNYHPSKEPGAGWNVAQSLLLSNCNLCSTV